jgi:hypothetical protein
VLVPVIAVILLLAVYPQFVLARSEQAVGASLNRPGLLAVR